VILNLNLHQLKLGGIKIRFLITLTVFSGCDIGADADLSPITDISVT
jgi:hypothetical protein